MLLEQRRHLGLGLVAAVACQQLQCQQLVTLHLTEGLLEDKEDEVAEQEKEIERLQLASQVLEKGRRAKEKEINRLKRAGDEQARDLQAMTEEIERLRGAGAEQEKGWRAEGEGWRTVNMNLRELLTAREHETVYLRHAGEEHERGWRAVVTARDRDILQHVHKINWLQASEEKARADLAASEQERGWLGRAGEEQEKELGAKEEDLAAKDAEIARLVLAGEEQAIVLAGLRRAGEQAAEQARQLLQDNQESARAATAAELLRASREHEIALEEQEKELGAKEEELAAKDAEIARLRLEKEEQVRLLSLRTYSV